MLEAEPAAAAVEVAVGLSVQVLAAEERAEHIPHSAKAGVGIPHHHAVTTVAAHAADQQSRRRDCSGAGIGACMPRLQSRRQQMDLGSSLSQDHSREESQPLAAGRSCCTLRRCWSLVAEMVELLDCTGYWSVGRHVGHAEAGHDGTD